MEPQREEILSSYPMPHVSDRIPEGALSLRHEMPWDVGFAAWLCAIWATFELILGWTRGDLYSHESVFRTTAYALFATVVIESDSWLGPVCSVYALAGFVAGHGLSRGRRYGYWILLALSVDGVATIIRGIAEDAAGPWLLAIILTVASGIWLILRRRLFYPSKAYPRAAFENAQKGVQAHKREIPKDVAFLGRLCFVLGGLGALAGLVMVGVIAHDPSRPLDLRPLFVCFGIVSVKSPPWMGLYFLISGCVLIATGYGLRKVHPVGWWLLLIQILDGMIHGMVRARSAGWLAFGLCVRGLLVAWLIWRVRLYHPFGTPCPSKPTAP